MAFSNKKDFFLKSEKATMLRGQLREMAKNPLYNTKVAGLNHADSNGVMFVDKHMTYMNKHRNMDHRQYVANLKIMMKLK